MWNILKFKENSLEEENKNQEYEKIIKALQRKLEKELNIIKIQQEIIKMQKKLLIKRENAVERNFVPFIQFPNFGQSKKKISEILDYLERIIIYQKEKERELEEERKKLDKKLKESLIKNNELDKEEVKGSSKVSNKFRIEREKLENLKRSLLEKEEELRRREEEIKFRDKEIYYGGIKKIGTFKDTKVIENKANTKEILRLKNKLKALESELKIKEDKLKTREKYLKEKEEELNRERERLFKNEILENDIEIKKGKIKTGVLRLDDLLLGGLPINSNVLVTGPPFIGKDVLLNLFIAQGLKSNTPCIYVTTNKRVSEIKEELSCIVPNYEEYEKKGLIYFVDAYSKSLGIVENNSNIEFAEPQKDLDEIELAINRIYRVFSKNFKQLRIVFNSISTLIAQSSSFKTFKIMQTLCGKYKEYGASSLFIVDPEMHKKSEIEMFKHLMDGVIEFEERNMKTFLRVRGICDVQTRAWVEYKHSKNMLDLVGSFSLEHIR